MCDHLYLYRFEEDNYILSQKLSLLKRDSLIQKQNQILKCDLIPLEINFCNTELLSLIVSVFMEQAAIRMSMYFLLKDFHHHPH